jgi:MFS family permease
MSIREDSRDPLFTPMFAGLWIFAFVTFFSAFQLLPAIPFRILELGGNKAEAGWFLAVYTFGSAFAAPIMGSLADQLGRRRTLITVSLLFVIFSIAYGVITNLILLLGVGLIHGALWSGILASNSALGTEWIPESRRTEGIAYWGLASNAAIAIAPAFGLWMVHFGWRTLCFEMAGISVLMTIAAFFLRERSADRATRSGVRELWDWRVTRLALTLTVVAFGYGGVTSYAAILAVERHIEPRSLYLSVFAASVVIIRLALSHTADRLGPHRIIYPSLAIIPLAFILLAVARDRLLLGISAALFGAGMGLVYPAFATFVLLHTDPIRRARTFGSIVWAFDTGIGTGSLVIGTLGQHFGLGTAFAVAAVLSCLSIPIFRWMSRRM